MKHLLSLLFILITSLVNAITYIPVHTSSSYHGHGGHMSNKQGLAMLIVCNIVFLFVYLVRTIMWLNGESDRKYLSYLFKNNDDILPININTICFICFNGLALLIISTMLISCIL